MEHGLLLPRIEKNIIKLAEIWTTLRLPTRVNANNPAFSLYGEITRYFIKLEKKEGLMNQIS